MPIAALAAVCLLVILLKAWMGRKLEQAILAGDFRLVAATLSNKDCDESDVDTAPDFYFHFYTRCGSKYTYKTDYRQFDLIEAGDNCYLILRKNRKRQDVPIFAYPVKNNPLDRELEEILKRDAR